jgi:hypothetical protein
MQPSPTPPPRQVREGEIINLRTPPDPNLAMLQAISLVMDRLFQVPGTRLRFGVNSVLMAVPVLGDVIPSLISLFILTIGLKNYRVPRVVAARMMFNSLLDASLGWIPVFGDIFDLYFKADTRNVRLLEQYIRPENQQPPTWGHWLFLGGLLLIFLIVLMLVIAGGVALGMWLFGNMQGGR